MTSLRRMQARVLADPQLNPAGSRTANTFQTEPLTVRISEACRMTGIGRSKLYELIGAGNIRTVKVGTITLVPVESLRNFLKLDS